MDGGGHDVVTVDDLMKAIKEALSGDPVKSHTAAAPLPTHTVFASGSFDAKTWLSGHVNSSIEGCALPC